MRLLIIVTLMSAVLMSCGMIEDEKRQKQGSDFNSYSLADVASGFGQGNTASTGENGQPPSPLSYIEQSKSAERIHKDMVYGNSE